MHLKSIRCSPSPQVTYSSSEKCILMVCFGSTNWQQGVPALSDYHLLCALFKESLWDCQLLLGLHPLLSAMALGMQAKVLQQWELLLGCCAGRAASSQTPGAAARALQGFLCPSQAHEHPHSVFPHC